MKVLIVGGGGREHAIAYCVAKSSKVEKMYCAPGNAGIAELAECVPIGAMEFDKLVTFAKEKEIDLAIVGMDDPLVGGLIDEFEKAGIRAFGPRKNAAILEGSKAFSKDFMIRHGLPTAKYKEYTDLDKAIADIDDFGYPVVIKADGLAAGKGVVIPENREDAIKTLKEMMSDKKFGDAGEKIVIEEFLNGIETSILAFVDHETIVPMVSAKDHKKVNNGENGLNTGGMGTFSPSEIYTDELAKNIKENVLDKTLKGFQEDGLDFKGILFVGLMITEDGPKVLEYNVRFGDPETQSVLFRLETDLNKIISAVIGNKLKDIDITYSDEQAICVMLTSGGYPESYEKGKVITGLDDLDDDIVVFHSGTKLVDGKIVTNGGRVIGITAKAKNVKEAGKKVYENIKKINFEGMHYRTDIWK